MPSVEIRGGGISSGLAEMIHGGKAVRLKPDHALVPVFDGGERGHRL